MTGSAKTLHVRVQILTFFTILKCHNLSIIWCSIVEILVSVQNFPALFWHIEIKNLLYYHDFTAVFVKMCKRRTNMEGFCRAGHIYFDQRQ